MGDSGDEEHGIDIGLDAEMDEDMEMAVGDAVQHASDVFDESMELTCSEFISLLRNSPKFVRKVALATDIPSETFMAFGDDELVQLFQDMDTDQSGTMSFDEFVRGLVAIRIDRETEKRMDEDIKEENILEEAYNKAVAAFENANFAMSEELDPQALRTPSWTQSLRCRSRGRRASLRSGSMRLTMRR